MNSWFITGFLTISLVRAGAIFQNHDLVPITFQSFHFGGDSFDDKLYLYPIDYYDDNMQQCPPKNQTEANKMSDRNLPNGLNISEVYEHDLFVNNHFYNAPMVTTFRDNSEGCKHLCDRQYKKVNVTYINDLIRKNYKYKIFVDDIQLGRESFDFETRNTYLDSGLPLGYIDGKNIPHLYNHFKIKIYYKNIDELNHKIVYGTIYAQSIIRTMTMRPECPITPGLLLEYDDYAPNVNRITYEIKYQEIQTTHVTYDNEVVNPKIRSVYMMIEVGLVVLLVIYLLNMMNNHSDEIILRDESSDNNGNGINKILYGMISIGSHLFLNFIIISLLLTFNFIKINSGFKQEVKNTVLRLFLITSPLIGFLNGKNLKLYNSHNFKEYLTVGFVNSLLTPFIILVFAMKYNEIFKSLPHSSLFISIKSLTQLSMAYIILTLSSLLITVKYYKISDYEKSLRVKTSNEKEFDIIDTPFSFKLVPNMIIIGLLPFNLISILISSIYLSLWYSHYFSTGNLLFSIILFTIMLGTLNCINIHHYLSIGLPNWEKLSFFSGISIGIYTFFYSIYLTEWRFGDVQSRDIFFLQNCLISIVVGLISATISFFACSKYIGKCLLRSLQQKSKYINLSSNDTDSLPPSNSSSTSLN